jgi:hypothetical protein
MNVETCFLWECGADDAESDGREEGDIGIRILGGGWERQ